MNEVRTTQSLANVLSTRAASSTGTVEAKSAKPAEDGKKLPETNEVGETQNVEETEESSKSEPSQVVETAVAQINDYVQSIQRDLQFSVDEELDQTVVKVVDGSSGELIRQIPEEVFLELARKLNEDGELRLMNAFG